MSVNRRWLLALVTLCSVFAVFGPLILSMPMRRQSETDLIVVYWLHDWNSLLTIVFLAVGAFLAYSIWEKSSSLLRKASLIVPVLLLVAAVFGSRDNFYEWIFRPLPKPGYAPISSVDHVKDSDMVIGIKIAGKARAYPVRLVGSHHVVNDEVAGQPYVVSY